jgi:gliding motility-associated-like protein
MKQNARGLTATRTALVRHTENRNGTTATRYGHTNKNRCPMGESTQPDRDADQKNTEHRVKASQTYTTRNAILIAFILALFAVKPDLHAQYCNGSVPTFTVNLTGNPTGSWISPNVQRLDQCCGVLAPEECVQFIVTLDPASLGIVFDVYSGAMPPGALYYQINCGPQTPVGTPICLTGVGPHYLTFCKPGGNTNEYIITSLGTPQGSADITLNDGCSGAIYATGYDEPSVNWNSIYPGAYGDFNGYLNCVSGCDSVIVTGTGLMPPYIDYQVCGMPFGGCGSPICDTVRCYFNPTLAVNITPAQPTICYGNTGIWLTANPSGGTPPYNYLWSNGATTQSVYVGPGNYTVQLDDASMCPPVSNSVTVTSFTATITANAGPDQHICTQSLTTQLNGSVTGVTTGQWIGGGGTYSPGNTSLNAVYTPSAAEVVAGQATLSLITTNNGTCPPDTDQVVIFIHQFQGSISVTPTDVSCFGQSNGSATATITNGNGTYTYSWATNPAQSGSTATGIPAGTYSVMATDMYGCSAGTTFSISEPPALSISAAGVPSSCFGGCSGQLVAVPAGGTQPYGLLWSNGCTNLSCSGICAGTYTIILSDANGCTTSATTTVTEPPAMVVNTSPTPAHCNLPDGSITSNVYGGTPGYSYLWMPGSSTAPTATNLAPGAYTLTVTDAQNCQAVQNVSVGNQPGVVAAVSNIIQPLCAGQCTGAASAAPTGGNGPYQFNWSNNTSGNSVNGLCASNYLLTVTDNDGCIDTASFMIQAPPPVTLVAQSPAPICYGQSVTMSAVASGGTPGYTYNWSSGTATVSPQVTTTYNVTATDANGCASPAMTVTVQVLPPLDVIVSGSGPSCIGSPVTLTAVAGGGNGGPYSYSWSPGNQTGNQIVVSPTSSIMYTVTASDGCTSPSATGTITINPLTPPVVSFSVADTAACENSCVQFTSSTPNAASWQWNFGDASGSPQENPVHCYSTAGTYNITLTVTDNNGCTGTGVAPGALVIHPNPTADYVLGPQPTTILNPSICFSDLSSADVTSWYWNFGDPNDATTSYAQNPCHSYSDTGNYCSDLVVHNNYGCISTAGYCLRIDPYYTIYVPNAFTPNHDNKNDFFFPVMFNIDESSYTMQIYDRWGNLVWETSDAYGKWDGTSADGQVVQMDTYVWKIRVNDYTGATHKLIGHVSVIK